MKELWHHLVLLTNPLYVRACLRWRVQILPSDAHNYPHPPLLSRPGPGGCNDQWGGPDGTQPEKAVAGRGTRGLPPDAKRRANKVLEYHDAC